jgi:CRP-like cAMP-binding protein
MGADQGTTRLDLQGKGDFVEVARRLRMVFRDAPLRAFEYGQPLTVPDRGLMALWSGWACKVHGWPDGRRAISEIYLLDDLIGLAGALASKPSGEAVALKSCTAAVLDASTVSKLIAEPSMAIYLASRACDAFRRAEERANRLTRLNAHERLACMLTDLHSRLRHMDMATDRSFNLPMSQQQIADHLGLTVVHVNRVIRQFREEGIAIVDHRLVIILDPARLRHLANGESDKARVPSSDLDTALVSAELLPNR